MANKLSAELNNRRLALTIARRSMRRNLAQTILIVLIIAMPMSLGAFALTYFESTTPTTAEQAQIELGQTQARFLPQIAVSDERLADPSKNDLYQMPKQEGVVEWQGSDSYVSTDQNGTIRDPRALNLTSGKWFTENTSTVEVKTKTGVGNLMLVEGEPWNQAFRGRYDIVFGGRVPLSANEVMVTQATLERTGLKLGDNLTLSGLDQSRLIVGVLKDSQLADNVSAVFAETASISGVKPEDSLATTAFYLVGTEPVSWKTVVEFNRHGISVLSRQVLFYPPADSEVPILAHGYMNSGEWNVLGRLATIAFYLPIALVPIAVLAGSAFSFGARRQARTLAILSSLGAKKKHLRFLTVANGIWLGFLGGILGSAVGLAVAWFLLPIFTEGKRASYPGFHIPFIGLAAIIIGGALIGAIVSLIPAIAAAKLDVLSTLRGVREAGKVKRRAGLGSLLVIGAGVALVSIGATLVLQYNERLAKDPAAFDPTLLTILQFLPIVGALVLLIGLMIGTGWLLVFVRGLFRRSGVAANYATNDLIYNRKRYQPVVAAVIATSFVAATLLGVFYSYAKTNADNYQRQMPANQVQSDAYYSITAYSLGNDASDKTRADYQKAVDDSSLKLQSKLRAALSVAEVASSAILNRHEPLMGIGFGMDQTTGTPILGAEGDQPLLRVNSDYLCPHFPESAANKQYLKLVTAGRYEAASNLELLPKFRGCQELSSRRDTFYVGSAADLAVLLGHPASKAAAQALAAGKAVTFKRGLQFGSKVKLDWYPSGTAAVMMNNSYIDPTVEGSPQPTPLPALVKSVELESVFEPAVSNEPMIMISPETATRLGIDYSPSLLVVNYKNRLTTAQSDQLNADMGLGLFQMDPGYQVDPEFWAWIILAAAGFFVIASTSIALGLAQIESRADQNTLGSIGAPRRYRARVLSLQAILLTSLGTVFGSAAGIYLAWTLMTVVDPNMFHFATVQFALLVAGIPLLAGLIFWFGTPRRQFYRVRLAVD